LETPPISFINRLAKRKAVFFRKRRKSLPEGASVLGGKRKRRNP